MDVTSVILVVSHSVDVEEYVDDTQNVVLDVEEYVDDTQNVVDEVEE